MESYSESYRKSGVDITAGYAGVKLMAPHVARTRIPGVVSGIGGFGGLFAPDLTGIREPVLVSGTDGVGTKLRIAQLLDKHDTVGIDCVAMCVNDIICCGAKPLFFLDYIAIGKNVPEKVAAIVSGVAEGCVQAGCALIGGETAEHPGIMAPEEYDLAGFSVGIVDKGDIIDPDRVRSGDVVLALPSSGLHSNGFSLVRKVFHVEHANLTVYCEDLGESLGEALLTGEAIAAKRYFPAWLIDEDNEYVQKALAGLKKAGIEAPISHFSFCTNGSHFCGEAGIPCIGYGPSLESLAHVRDEYIEIEQLTKACRGFASILRELTQ